MTVAYYVLTDERKRAAYDALRKEYSFYDYNDPRFIELKKLYVLEAYRGYWKAHYEQS